MEVDGRRAAATSEYKGKTYYFCAPGCKKPSMLTRRSMEEENRKLRQLVADLEREMGLE